MGMPKKDKAEKESKALDVGRVVNLCAYMVAVSAFLEWLASHEDEAPKGVGPVRQEAIRLIRRFKKEILLAVDHLAICETKPGGSRLKAPLTRARQGGSPESKAVRQARFIKMAFKFASIRQDLRVELFGSGKPNTLARRIGNLQGSAPTEAILELAGLPPIGGLRVTRAWIKKAADIMGVGGTSEERVADIGEVQNIANEIKDLDRKLKVLPGGSDESRNLQAERSTKMDTLVKVAQSSDDEQAALGAASSIIYENQSHATDIGKQLMMTEEQEDAMMVTGKSLIAAGAGSGKTRVLAGKVIDIINREGGKSSQVIATSFSKKSAAELKERVLKYGGAAILDGGDDGFGTTHSIGFSLLKKIKPKFKRAQVLEGSYLIKMAMKQVEMSSYNAPAPPDPVGMFEGLLGTQNRNVSISDADEGADAGASSEEDAVLRKVVDQLYGLAAWGANKGYGWAHSEEKALSPLVSRLDSLTVEGLSPAEKALINKMVSKDRYKRSLTRGRLDPNYKVAAYNKRKGGNYWKEPANEWFNIGGKFLDEEGRAIGARRVALAVGNYRSDLMTPSEAWAKDKSVMAACYGAYMWLKDNEPDAVGKVDFTDMQLECIKALIENPKALATVQAQYKWVLVDEAQDLNKLQHLLFGLIAGAIDPATQEYKADGSMTANTFTFIGDDKQAIYEFRGATPDEYSEKSDMRGGSFDTKLISSNFRSGKAIVDAANKLISHNEKQIPMVCSTDPKRGEGVIEYVNVGDHGEAASRCADDIQAHIDNEGWSEPNTPSFGVAVRTNAEALAFGLELIKRRIPFRSKMNFFADPTTKALTGWLTLAGADLSDKKVINDVVLKAYQTPKFYLDKKFNSEVQKKARGMNYLEWLKNGGWNQIYEGRSEWRNKNVKTYVDTLVQVQSFEGSPKEVLEQILSIKGVGFRGKPAESIVESLISKTKGSGEAMDMLHEESGEAGVSEQDIKNLALAPIAPLMGLLEEYEDMGPALGYIQELQDASKGKTFKDDPDDDEADKPAVTIDTCHGWKGLEARHMWVPMAAGVFPHNRSMGDEDAMASERRLAYVALTRGRDSVTVLCPAVNHIGKPAGPSQFVSEGCIPNESREDWQEDADQARTASTRERELWKLIRTSNENENLTEKEWREYELSQSYGEFIPQLGVR